MSEAMNPRNPANQMDQGMPSNQMDQGIPSRPVNQEMPVHPVEPGSPTWPVGQGSQVVAMSQREPLVVERPGLVTFAAIMMFILAGFQLVWAIVEFVNAAWLSGVTYGTFNGYLWLWAILDLVLAAAAFYAGYDILRGGTFGRVFGVVVAGISSIRWFFYLPAAPWIGIVMIAVDIIIIYALVSHSEFFSSMQAGAR
ncbi:MAG: hypothetical protein ACLQUY_19490 [Ktedonobacterales bacterium]